MELDDYTSALAEADFFRICDDEQRRLLAFSSERRSFNAGDVIYKRGDASEGAFVLMTGEVLVGDSDGTSFKPQRISEHGAVLGEMGLILSRARRASLRAATDVELLFVPRAAFAKLMRQFPLIAERAAMRIEEEMNSFLGAMEPFRHER